ncbi:MAG TPA: hypothetical protein VFX39_02405, partial [Gemmatimonadaceae bacterium]|nr:hypothetical protein [Gemmatimonadaceae bacterium]
TARARSSGRAFIAGALAGDDDEYGGFGRFAHMGGGSGGASRGGRSGGGSGYGSSGYGSSGYGSSGYGTSRSGGGSGASRSGGGRAGSAGGARTGGGSGSSGSFWDERPSPNPHPAPRVQGAGAARSVPAPVQEEDVSQDAAVIAVGARVRHAKFGSGTIAELTGSGRDLKARIDFDDQDVGRKTLVVAQANLEREWD